MNKFTEIVTDAYDRQNFLPKPFLAQIPLVLHNYLVRKFYKMRLLPSQCFFQKLHAFSMKQMHIYIYQESIPVGCFPPTRQP